MIELPDISLGNDEIEINDNIEIKQFKHKSKELKIEKKNKLKKEILSDIIKEVPEKNTYTHLISNGTFDYFGFIPVMQEKLGKIDELVGSTWTMNRYNVNLLFNLFDKNLIKNMSILTGVYFKKRETAVYATLTEGMIKRKQKLKSCQTHAKIILISNETTRDYIVIEGSANWTGNPRIEQNIITNNKDVYDFHKNWILEIINKK